MINNRPKSLENYDYYRQLPRGEFSIDFSATHDLLKMDILELFGLLPLEEELCDIVGFVIPHQPTEEMINYYEKKKANFQMVMIVANIFNVNKANGVFSGKPYSISLIPASKRGKPTSISPAYFRSFDLTRIEEQKYVYLGFNPFDSGYVMFGDISILYDAAQNYYSDMIGFVIGIYFLSNKFNLDQVRVNELVSGNKFIQEKYRKLRIKKYFQQFETIQPRKIWGADSPIELFLIQSLAHKEFYPEIQSMIFEDGTVYPSIHHMISENKKRSEVRMITEADIYFREEKIAIFCDSTKHHRSTKAKTKDLAIDQQLNSLGITSIRVPGTEIVNDIDRCTDNIITSVNQQI